MELTATLAGQLHILWPAHICTRSIWTSSTPSWSADAADELGSRPAVAAPPHQLRRGHRGALA
jgi:hypothetical protein